MQLTNRLRGVTVEVLESIIEIRGPYNPKHNDWYKRRMEGGIK